MVLTELKEALGLLRRLPALWALGLAAGLLAAGIWLAYNDQGTFFATRLVLIGSLVTVFFLAGNYAIIKSGTGSIREVCIGGIQYFFRVLLPLMVLIFCTITLVALVTITLSFGGMPADTEFLGVFSICIFIPVVFLTFFFDTAAVFEDRKIFDAIRRSIEVVTLKSVQVFKFYVIAAAISFAVTFALMIVWVAALYDKLEPLTHFNETQIAAFTPGQLATMIGPDGTVVTAACLFIGILVLLPILSAYKACFFRSISQGSVSTTQPMTGEFDSKGRWYKY